MPTIRRIHVERHRTWQLRPFESDRTGLVLEADLAPNEDLPTVVAALQRAADDLVLRDEVRLRAAYEAASDPSLPAATAPLPPGPPDAEATRRRLVDLGYEAHRAKQGLWVRRVADRANYWDFRQEAHGRFYATLTGQEGFLPDPEARAITDYTEIRAILPEPARAAPATPPWVPRQGTVAVRVIGAGPQHRQGLRAAGLRLEDGAWIGTVKVARVPALLALEAEGLRVEPQSPP